MVVVGDAFGRYVLAEPLGRGGMGEVWKARDMQLDRWVALKLLTSSDDEAAVRFMHEARTAAKLAHPNIAAVHEVGEAGGRRFIAMQLVNGPTLKDAPKRDRRTLAAVVRDAARAIEYAHAQGVIHRDLKPENIMIEADRVFVMDFGLARAQHGARSISGLIVGTPAYMPPEQARGDRVDARADVYALGATLHAAVRGRPPFDGANALDILARVSSEDAATLEGDLGLIVAKAMSKDPGERYATAREFADDLDRWLNGQPIRARAPTLAYRVRKIVSRHLAVVTTAALALVLLVALGAYGAVWFVRERRYQAANETARTKVNEFLVSVAARSPRRAQLGAEAVAALEQALAVDDRRPMSWVWMGRCQRMLARMAEAQRCWERALAVEPGHAEALVERGRDAYERYRRARPLSAAGSAGGRWRFDPDPPETPDQQALRETAVRDLLAARRAGVPAHLAAYVDAVTSYQDRNWSAAETSFTAYLDRIGWDARAFLWRGWSRHMLGRTAEALEDVGRAIELDTADGAAHNARGIVHLTSGLIEPAAADFAAAIAADPSDAAAHGNMGRVNMQRKRYADALANYGRAIECRPSEPRAYAYRAAALASLGRLDEAEADVRAAERLNDRSGQTHVVRARLRFLRGDDTGAIEQAGLALAINPDDADALLTRAVALSVQGRLAPAEEDLTRAIEIEPPLATAWAARGNVRLALGRPREAVADFTRSLELEPLLEPDVRGPLAEARRRAGE